MREIIRTLIADDTILYRKIVGDIISDMPDVEIIGAVSTGKIALERIEAFRPDLVILDIEMPEMNGLDVLQAIKSRGIDLDVIILSAFSERGSEDTVRALELGAFDFIVKPSGTSLEQNKAAIKDSLLSKIKACGIRQEIRRILRGSSIEDQPVCSSSSPKSCRAQDAQPRILKPDMVLIGVSTGGPQALGKVLSDLPSDIGVPLLIVQHMPAMFTRSLAESLSSKSSIKVKEAEHGEEAVPNTAYIAPGGRQMGVYRGADAKIMIRVEDGPPENNCRPSVDYLFRSAADAFPGRAAAVIMTGMGNDGTAGLVHLKRYGCFVVAQDESSCVVFGMPKEAIEAGVVDAIVPLDDIADTICKSVKRRRI